ncbi:hypothetical protein [Thermomonospora catenispora]|uniref:hypothetical protein n=1 Tax=Thermomonospora catenispora TaxID=2493090 RepID=UPI00111FABC7|nr:hypothetical protein [Thermomonospora catenispora]TNY35406.1 hypothetical protein EIO00_18890 [Thermomonospora catenispora]
MSGEPPAGAPGTAALDVAEDGTWRPAPAPRAPENAPAPAAPQEPRTVPAGAVVAALGAVPPPEPTGDERVDAALGRLVELAGLPVGDHVEIFEEVHRGLQDVLASVDQQTPVPRPPGPGIVPPRPGHAHRSGA